MTDILQDLLYGDVLIQYIAVNDKLQPQFHSLIISNK